MKQIVKQKINPDFMPIPVEAIHVGKVIGFDCYIKRFNDYVVIIKSGTLITPELYENISKNRQIYISLKERASYKVYCEKNSTVSLEDKEKLSSMEEAVQKCLSLPQDVTELALPQEKMMRIYTAASKLMQAYEQNATPLLPLAAINIYVDTMLEVLIKNGTLYNCLSTLSPEQYSFQTHAVNVSILSAMLGYNMKLDVAELRNLALASLLHDIGKKNIPKSILDKDGPLSEDEFKTVRKHPELSDNILRENKIIDPKILSAIKYHHERLDGSGYPAGLKGNKIHNYAQIIGVCDVFDALTAERTFRAKYSTFNALAIMKKKMAHELNQKYVDGLIRLLQKK